MKRWWILQCEEAKKAIMEILGSVSFEGHFNKCFDGLKETQQEELINWVRNCRDHKISPIQSKKDRKIIVNMASTPPGAKKRKLDFMVDQNAFDEFMKVIKEFSTFEKYYNEYYQAALKRLEA